MLGAFLAAAAVATAPGLAVSQGGTIYVEGRQLTRGTQPAWSPDRRSIAFRRDGQIFTIDVKSKKERRVVERSPGLHWPANDPSWSPDGKRLAFTGTSDVLTVDLKTKRLAKLTAAQASWQGSQGPEWSPDGKWIVFSRSTTPDNRDVYVMRADGSGLHRLTTTDWDEHSPTWSPDGKRVVFAGIRSSHYELYSIARGGGDERRLTDTEYDESQPSFSRDGKRILYVHDGRVAHVRANGTDVREAGRGASADW